MDASPSSARSAPRPGRRRLAPIGLALAGGGPVGAVYEIGALCALQDALDGIDFADLDVYVGVSSGALVGSMLANGFSPAHLREILVDAASPEFPVHQGLFLAPASGELVRRAAMLPGFALDALRQGMHGGLGGRGGLVSRFGRLLPTGMFDNEPLASFLEQAFGTKGRSNDFRRLGPRLRLVATDLDSSETVAFGSAGHDRVPISRAVQASTALPGLYPPVRIDGRDYVDGALRKTMHASVALHEGARLLFCINPIVPFDARLALSRSHRRPRRLVEGGLSTVLSQAFRTLIQSRMQVGMARYRSEYKGAHVLLFEPPRDDPHLLFTNVFDDPTRQRVFEQAYRATLLDLSTRKRALAPCLERHGISIRNSKLRAVSAPRAQASSEVLQRLGGALDRLERWVERP